MIIPKKYALSIQSRSHVRYLAGLIIRAKKRIIYSLICSFARAKGAIIGKNTIIPFSLALHSNSNLQVGDDVIIETSDIDLRTKVVIEDHVIINKKVSIIRASHIIDRCSTYDTKYYDDLLIESYSWLATSCTLLPSVSRVASGSIIGACSVLHKSTEDNGVYSGNPAQMIRVHSGKFDQLVVCSLKGGDFNYYRAVRR